MTVLIFMFSMPQQFITPIISATAVIIGSLIGAICTWITTKHSIRKNKEIENKIFEENRKYDETKSLNSICENINIIRLDICNAIFQSIRNIKKIKNKNYLNRYPIPINKDYSKAVSCLSKEFNLKELSYIYQLYAIIEILNEDLRSFNNNVDNSDKYSLIQEDCELLLKKVYGENYLRVYNWDIDTMTYKDIYDNSIIKEGYKEVFKKLEKSRCL